MKNNQLQSMFIKLLSSEIRETELDPSLKKELMPDVVKRLYELSRNHEVVNIIASALNKQNIVDKDFSEFSTEQVKSIYRHEKIKHTYKQICEIFENIGVKYIPLKGMVLRKYYSNENMRTSCDIDILINETDVDIAIDGLTKSGFKLGDKYFHDISLYSPNKMHLELHYNIFENIEKLDNVLKNAWDYALPVNDFCYEFTDEFLLFHVFAHMYYHFVSGGCGIRSLIDIWILKEQCGITAENIKELLETAKIYKFAKGISLLADQCFSDKPLTCESEILLSYIINGGTYGSGSNVVAMKKGKNKNFIVYSFKRFFLKYKVIKYEYPILKKYPVFLPFCYLHRLFCVLFGKKRKRALRELKVIKGISEIELENIKVISDYLDI